MPRPSDSELLRAYVERKAEDAFAEIVSRHAGLVHAACRRILGDDHAAEDAAQAGDLSVMSRMFNGAIGNLVLRSERRGRGRDAEAGRGAADAAGRERGDVLSWPPGNRQATTMAKSKAFQGSRR